jgi:polyhydroxybutyrate depolymerase
MVLLVHGYTWTGDQELTELSLPDMQIGPHVLVVVEGRIDDLSEEYWWATLALRPYGTDVDSTYLRAVIDDTIDTYNIDTNRVIVLGHSNGAFMALRLAHDHADVITHAIALSGVDADADYTVSDVVHVLQIHGDSDSTIDPAGGTDILGLGGGDYPSVATTVSRWVTRGGGQQGATTTPADIDLDSVIAGAETTRIRYSCTDGAVVERWTVVGGDHDLDWRSMGTRLALQWAFALRGVDR